MDELPRDPRKRPPQTPGAPLPRLYKGATEPEPETEKSPPKKSKKEPKDKAPKAKGRASKGKDGKPALIEETPTLDTYQTRKMVRVVLGMSLALGMLLLAGVLLWRNFRPEREFDDKDLFDEAALGQPQADHASDLNQGVGEIMAADLMRRAREAADAPRAQAQLDRILRDYPKTAAAREAREALDRSRQGLPLFAAHAVLAEKAEPAAPAAPAPPPAEVVAVTTPPAPTQGTAQVVAPSAVAEPYRAASQVPAAPGVAPRPLPTGFTARAEAGVHASGWPLEIVGDRDGASMALVPAATFLMGRDDDDATPAERPAHRVALSAYYIDQHEVTVRQYNLYREDMARRGEPVPPLAPISDPTRGAVSAQDNPDLPAVMVAALEARKFAVWSGKQLPTEAQWEMAARGTDGRLHPWGSSPPSWEKPREPKQIGPVMSFPSDRSPFGVYDLAGNAWEWTNDYFDPRYYQQLRTQTVENPGGPRESSSRPPQVTIKGSSKTWTASYREGMKKDTKLPFLGFRCVLSVEQSPRTPAEAEPPAQPVAVPNRGGNVVIPF
jgi:sulfatase modifying factor 1